jgi:uncharacterized protein
MVIDIHSHLAFSPIYPSKFLSEMFAGSTEDEKVKINKILPLFLKDKEGSAFLKQMDIAEIGKAVLLIIDGGIGLGEAILSIEEIYELHFNILKNHPDRFIVFGGIDPRRGLRGLSLFKKGIVDYGFRGLKLYPPMGFSLNDESLAPILKYCNDNHLPVLIHTGPSLNILKNEYADPLSVKEIAKNYKDIKFILAHAGHSLTSQLIDLIQTNENFYADIAGYRSKYIESQGTKSKSPALLNIFNEEINKKILFGSDWPLFNFMTPLSTQIEHLKTYAENNGLKKSCLDNILYKNALEIL